ncbi:MAG: anthranilate phosphoribosyltransferase [SAR202 cluster bacterium]|nr:anthranilate phosphoribosyltransferase [SAR202 cluster bacterium]|tara:strand:+ start:5696 stop:6712 length:1017 start_codon:yes stop_codon:yes gene_type:complete
MLNNSIEKLILGKDLSIEESKTSMDFIMDGQATSSQIAAFLVSLRIKGETVEEITGMATSMRNNSLTVPNSSYLVDTCGTGGDGFGTINASTISAIIAASGGVKVAKHGNRAASSKSGSADVLEGLGVVIDLSPDLVARSIEKTNFGFMFAQTFHPAMRHVGPTRRELGIRTVFNFLGPLTNPAKANAQVLGVSDPSIGVKMANVLKSFNIEHALIVHGLEGLDEISVCGPTQIWEVTKEGIKDYQVTPEEFGMKRYDIKDLLGGEINDNVNMFREIIQGNGSAVDFVVLNAASVLYVGNKVESISEGVNLARELIVDGLVVSKLEEIIETTQSLKSL